MKKGDNVFVVGLRGVGGADAQSQLDLFKEVLLKLMKLRSTKKDLLPKLLQVLRI